METIFNPNGTIRRRSRNLAGIIRELRDNPACGVAVNHTGDDKWEGLLSVWFYDGAYTETLFASHSVAVDWIRNRRNAKGARLVVDHVDCGNI